MTLNEAKAQLDTTKPRGSVNDADYKVAKKWTLKDKDAACLSRPWCNYAGYIVASDGKRLIELNREQDDKSAIVPCSMHGQGSSRYHVSGTASNGKFIVCDKKEEFSVLDFMKYPNHRKFFDGLDKQVKFYIAFDAEKTKALCAAVNAIGGDFRCVKLTRDENGGVHAFAGNPNGVYVQARHMATITDADGLLFIGNALSMISTKEPFIGIDPTFLSDYVADFARLPLGYIGAEKPLYAEREDMRAMILPMRLK